MTPDDNVSPLEDYSFSSSAPDPKSHFPQKMPKHHSAIRIVHLAFEVKQTFSERWIFISDVKLMNNSPYHSHIESIQSSKLLFPVWSFPGVPNRSSLRTLFRQHPFSTGTSNPHHSGSFLQHGIFSLRSTGSISSGSFQIHFSPKPLKI